MAKSNSDKGIRNRLEHGDADTVITAILHSVR